MELLKALYGIHSMSGSERKMKKFIKRYVNAVVPGCAIEHDNKGNLYITKGKSETYPCIVAHLDQVQTIHDPDFTVMQVEDTIFAFSPSMRRMNGLGADDKNGIWIALKCLAKYDAIKLAFFVQEEVGDVGSSAADMGFFKDCRFVIEPDRRGSSDLITRISYIDICSKEFEDDLPYEDFGYKPESGLMTDVMALAENGVGLACINMSCGYYNPHTDSETTSWKDLNNALSFVEKAIETCTKVYKHDADYSGYGSLTSYGDYNSRNFDWDSYYADRYGSYFVSSRKDLIIKRVEDYPSIEDYVFDMLYYNLLEGHSASDVWNAISADCETYGYTYTEFLDLAREAEYDVCY